MVRPENKHRRLSSAVRQCFPTFSETTTTTHTTTTTTTTTTAVLSPPTFPPITIMPTTTVMTTTIPSTPHVDHNMSETHLSEHHVSENQVAELDLSEHQPVLRFPPDVYLTFAMFSKAVHGIGSEIFKLAYEWDTKLYQFHYEYADYPGRSQLTLPRHVRSLPQAEAFSSSKVAQLVERAHIFLRAQIPFIARFHRQPNDRFSDLNDAFRAFFDTDLFPMPKTIVAHDRNFWTNDERFTDQFLNGCNPTVIKRLTVDDVEKMPRELLQETDPRGRNARKLAEMNSLYVADYELLATKGIARGTHEDGSFTNPIKFGPDSGAPDMVKHFYAPYVAFYQNDDGSLGVLGIMLTRRKDCNNAVYNLNHCKNTPNIYTFAKMHVACADNQLHQFYSHLGRCHLIFEPFGVAVRNVFQNGNPAAREHVVGLLLAPHFRDHMAINWLARNTLVAHGEDVIPFTDANFAIGSSGGLRLLAAKYKSWRLEKEAFPAQLRARGFDPDGDDGLRYYYRDDGMLIWRALEKYVEESLKEAYKSDSTGECSEQKERDARIADDPVLKLWCEEMRREDRADVQSFPEKFTSLGELRDTITTIIYNVSAEHAAVNASQERYLAYVPNRPNALFRPVPSPDGEDMKLDDEILKIQGGSGDDHDIGASMPISFAFFQVQFAHLLTLPASRTLLQIEGEGLPPSASEQLKRDLTIAHHQIRARNMKIERDTPNRAPYEFLDPAQVAQSIEI